MAEVCIRTAVYLCCTTQPHSTSCSYYKTSNPTHPFFREQQTTLANRFTMGNANSNKVQNKQTDAYERVGTDADYLAYRHCSMNNIDRNGPLSVLMLDCSNTPKIRNDQSTNLYPAFHNASPRRRKSMDFCLESAADSKFYRREILIDGKRCVLDIEEANLVTGTVDRQSNQMVDPSIRTSQIFLLCFAVNSQKSFQNALDMVRHIRREKEAVDDEAYAITFIVTHWEMREFCRGSGLSRSEMVKRAIASEASYVETSFALKKNTDCAIDLFAHGRGAEVTVEGDVYEEKDHEAIPDLPASPAQNQVNQPLVHFSDIDLGESEDERVFLDVVVQDDGDAQSNSAVGVDAADGAGDARPRRDAMASDSNERAQEADVSRPLDAPLSNAEHDELDNLLRELQQQSVAAEKR